MQKEATKTLYHRALGTNTYILAMTKEEQQQLAAYSTRLHSIWAELETQRIALEVELSKFDSTSEASEAVAKLQQQVDMLCDRSKRARYVCDKALTDNAVMKQKTERELGDGSEVAAEEEESKLEFSFSVSKGNEYEWGKTKESEGKWQDEQKNEASFGIALDSDGNLVASAGYKRSLIKKKREIGKGFSLKGAKVIPEFSIDAYLEVKGDAKLNKALHKVDVSAEIGFSLGLELSVPLAGIVAIKGGAGVKFVASTVLHLDLGKQEYSLDSSQLAASGEFSIGLEAIGGFKKLLDIFDVELSLELSFEVEFGTIPLPSIAPQKYAQGLNFDTSFVKNLGLPPALAFTIDAFVALGELLEWLDGAINTILEWLGDLWDAISNTKWDDMLDEQKEKLAAAFKSAAKRLKITKALQAELQKITDDDERKKKLFGLLSTDSLVKGAERELATMGDNIDRIHELETKKYMGMMGRLSEEEDAEMQKLQQEVGKSKDILDTVSAQIMADVSRFELYFEERNTSFALAELPKTISARLVVKSDTAFVADALHFSLFFNGEEVSTKSLFKQAIKGEDKFTPFTVSLALPTSGYDPLTDTKNLLLGVKLDLDGKMFDKIQKIPVAFNIRGVEDRFAPLSKEEE